MENIGAILVMLVVQSAEQNAQAISSGKVNPPVLVAGSIGPDDYPTGSDRPSGTTRVNVEVDVSGRVSDCQIERSSGSKVLDDKTCAIFKERMRYTPATQSSGHQIPYRISHNINWRMPGPPEPLASMRSFWVELALVVSPDGTVKSCEVIKNQPLYPGTDEGPCAWATKDGRYKPVEGNKDRHLRYRYSMEVEVAEPPAS